MGQVLKKWIKSFDLDLEIDLDHSQWSWSFCNDLDLWMLWSWSFSNDLDLWSHDLDLFPMILILSAIILIFEAVILIFFTMILIFDLDQKVCDLLQLWNSHTSSVINFFSLNQSWCHLLNHYWLVTTIIAVQTCT